MGAQNDKEQPLKIKIQSGDTQSQELFDFQSQKRIQCDEVLEFPSKLILNDDGVNYIKDQSQLPFAETLYDLRLDNYRQIQLDCSEESDVFNPIWRVIGDHELFPVEEGDQLKLGKIRITLKIIVMKSEEQKREIEKQVTEQLNNSFEKDHTIKSSEDACRVCFQKMNTTQDPLLSLCKCSGSVKYTHFSCLKDWVANNIQCRRSQNFISYSYIEPMCQICKSKITNQFEHLGMKYTLYQFEKLEAPYALFQNSVLDEEVSKTRISQYMIKLEQNQDISVGRNDNSQVVLKDISVSRNHCSFRYEKGRLFIRNRNSKFGTLIRPQGKWDFQAKQGITLQLGSKIIEISQQTTLNNCCCSPTQSYSLSINCTNDNSVL